MFDDDQGEWLIGPRQALAEAALWTGTWHYQGELRALQAETLAAVLACELALVLAEHDDALLSTAQYAWGFVRRLNNQGGCLTDLPCATDIGDFENVLDNDRPHITDAFKLREASMASLEEATSCNDDFLK